MKNSASPYLTLMRPANIVTAIADIVAGVVVAGVFLEDFSQYTNSIVLLILSTIGLYGGGVVLNDYFDADIDARERPERPIPSGRISKQGAGLFGLSLLMIGVFSALFVSSLSGIIALGVALSAVIYDSQAKDHPLFGPLFMGLCRAGNLLLGISIIPGMVAIHYMLAIIPILFIAAITLTSQGEVKGHNKWAVGLSMGIDLVLVILILFWQQESGGIIMQVLPFLLLWLLLNLSAKGKALMNNQPENIMKAVKIGVISLIPMDATIAAIFGGWMHGVLVLILLPLSFFMAKRFAVT